MNLDKFSNPIFNETDVFDVLYTGHQSVLPNIVVENSYELSQLAKLADLNFNTIESKFYNLSLEDFDTMSQNEWFMPDEYYKFDVYTYCIDKCQNDIEKNRVIEELTEFNNRNMFQLLQWLKYFVDTCLSNDIVWGVGRGSSVASFVLYLLNVHKINSIKYNLNWQDFLR